MSTAATPAMAGWAAFPDRYLVVYTEHNAFEVLGPGTGLLVGLSEAASVMFVPLLVVLWALAWRRRPEIRLDRGGVALFVRSCR